MCGKKFASDTHDSGFSSIVWYLGKGLAADIKLAERFSLPFKSRKIPLNRLPKSLCIQFSLIDLDLVNLRESGGYFTKVLHSKVTPDAKLVRAISEFNIQICMSSHKIKNGLVKS